MFRSISLGVLLLLLSTEFDTARAQAFFTVKNSAVVADVSTIGSGRFAIYLTNPSTPKKFLSFPEDSYLTVSVNGKFYTNNPNLLSNSSPGPGTLLQNGATRKLGDTIRTTWQPQGANSFDLIQDIYPVFFPFFGSGQIVYKFSVVNRTDSALNVQAQFLLDGYLSSPDTSNDDAPITTRFGYTNDWKDFSTIPPYFIATERPISSKTFPGNIAIGFNNDSLAPEPMGLIEPIHLAFVDWPTIVQFFTFGDPFTTGANPPNTATDEALLIQWPAFTVGPNATKEIGRGSYGMPACANPICFGNLDAMSVHSDHIVWDPINKVYTPNSFPVDAIVWNPNGGATATDATATQTITNSATGGMAGPVRIISPTPISNNGFSQQHAMVGTVVPSFGASSITWRDTVLADISLMNCSTDSTYDITVSVQATGISQPIFTNGPCSCPIMVDCQQKADTFSTIPILTVLSRTGSFDGSICNARCIHAQASDPRACKTCSVTSVTATELQNMTFAIEDSANWKFSVCVIDSMQNGSATVLALDGTGQFDTARYTYCTIADTKAPLVRFIAEVDSGPGVDIYQVSDTQAWDRGVDTIYFTNVQNVTISLGMVRGSGIVPFSVVGLHGSFCVTAINLAGNKFDTCFASSPASVSSSPPPPLVLSISPNPTSGDVSIAISGAPSADIEIFDVLGREVTKFHIEGYYEWQTGLLPAGTYIVRARSADGAVLSKRVLKN